MLKSVKVRILVKKTKDMSEGRKTKPDVIFLILRLMNHELNILINYRPRDREIDRKVGR